MGDFAQDIPTPYGEHWHGILFRKTYKQLEELIARSKEIYPRWFPGCRWHSSGEFDMTWRWPNGASLKMRHMDHENDWEEYWGHSYTWIGWDELALWASDIPYMRLKARLRCAKYPIPNMRIRASANPGGAGHHWVKQYFKIGEHPHGGVVFDADDDSGMKRLYIKARISDNKVGIENDPQYDKRLNGLGSKQFVKALKEGDWNVIAGAFFPEFGDQHIAKPMQLPKHWTRFRAMDWGSAKPFSVGWYAVSDGELPQFPRGAIIKYREWYGMQPGKPNVGLKMDAEKVADGILKREEKGEVVYGVIDPSAFAENGGPSIAQRMANHGVYFREADNKRVSQVGAIGGWDQLRGRLVGTCEVDDVTGDVKWETGQPMLYIFETCVHTIRTVPALQHDSTNAEDVDTDGEDHAPDETRYACMSRPWTSARPRKSEPPRGARTIKEMTDRFDARQNEVRRI